MLTPIMPGAAVRANSRARLAARGEDRRGVARIGCACMHLDRLVEVLRAHEARDRPEDLLPARSSSRASRRRRSSARPSSPFVAPGDLRVAAVEQQLRALLRRPSRCSRAPSRGAAREMTGPIVDAGLRCRRRARSPSRAATQPRRGPARSASPTATTTLPARQRCAGAAVDRLAMTFGIDAVHLGVRHHDDEVLRAAERLDALARASPRSRRRARATGRRADERDARDVRVRRRSRRRPPSPPLTRLTTPGGRPASLRSARRSAAARAAPARTA